MDSRNQTKNTGHRIEIDGPIIIGAGPSGLAVSACLSRNSIPSLILERSECIASLWQNRTYDRLKLHLPKKFCELPFVPFPVNFPKYPSKQQFVSYMEHYADHFGIRPLFGKTVVEARHVKLPKCPSGYAELRECPHTKLPEIPSGHVKLPECPSVHVKLPECPLGNAKFPECSSAQKLPECPSGHVKLPECPYVNFRECSSRNVKLPECPYVKVPECPSGDVKLLGLKLRECPSGDVKLPECPSGDAKLPESPLEKVKLREWPSGGCWVVRTEDGREYASRWLVVATGENAEAVVPEIAGLGAFGGEVLHTSGYKSGSVFENKRVLVIGCGNSGMEVSLDLCRHNASPFVVVRNSVHILPREMFGFSTFGVAMALLKWLPLRLVDKFLLLVANCILGNTDKLGLRRPKTGPLELKNATGKTPVLDVGALSQIKAGNIKVVEGVREITKKGAKFMDGKEKEFDSIILATGYKSNVPCWLKGCDFFNEQGMPKTLPNSWKGENGLYTVGFTRRGILGTVSDSLKIAQDIKQQWSRTTSISHITLQK